MTVRAAVAADVPALLALVRRYWAFEGIGGFDALRIELLLKELIPGGVRGEILVSEAAGRLDGYLALVYILSLEHRGLMAEIDELFVLPEARSRGTGSALLECAEAHLRARGCVRLQLQLALDNATGRRFYARHGYGGRAGYTLLDKAL
jgi:GNAT superfamily N-acetyltransferase